MVFGTHRGAQPTALSLLTLAAVLIPAASAHAAAASFTYSPGAPLTGQTVTFTSTSTGAITEDWDLDGGGACDDASGPQVSRSFPTPGSYKVRLCVNGDDEISQRTIVVGDRAPVASIAWSPAHPVTGEPVTLTSTSADPDGPITGFAWGFGDDGVPDDAYGASVSRSFRRSGVHPVFLHVFDAYGQAGDAIAWIPVRRPPPELLSPFPVVRLVGRTTATGAVISLLTVNAPPGARVAVRCHGAACPYRRAAARASDLVRFRRLQRALGAGTVIAVRVTKRGTIGKYTRFRIRRGERPARLDRCLKPGAGKPARCPST